MFKKVEKLFLSILLGFFVFTASLVLVGCGEEEQNKPINPIQPTLRTPFAVVNNDELRWNVVENAKSYNIYDGENLLTTVSTTFIDLSSYKLRGGDHSLTVEAVATGYNNSAKSTAVNYHITDFTDLSVREYTGNNGVVAAASAYAAKAGLIVLEQGGNAFDAAVAVGFALGVVEPNASGIGGGGLMVAWDARKQEFCGYNYREFVPGKATTALFKAGVKNEETKTGYGNLSVSGIPNLCAGLCGVYEERTSGNVTLADCLAPAIDYAENGFVVPKELAQSMKDNWPQISGYNEDYAWEVFSKDGFELGIPEGELLIQKDYANTLKLVAEDSKIEGHNGAAGFYTGPTAEAILASNGFGVQGLHGTVGLMTQEDFNYAMANYPEKLTMDNCGLLTSTFGDYNICTAGIPSSGGCIMIQALNCLSSYFGFDGLKQLGHNTADYINAVQTALFLGYSDKKQYIGDLRHDNTDKLYRVKVFTDYGYATERMKKYYKQGKAIDYTKTLYGSPETYAKEHGLYPSSELVYDGVNDYEANEHYSTTSYSVADKDGNIVSVTQTLNHFWGTGVMPEGTGFYMNNNLTSISGTSTTSVNRLKPYKNPVSHIMPTIVTDQQGNPVLTLGSPGSFRIPAAVTNTLLNVLVFDMGMQEAIDSARAFIYPDATGTAMGLELEQVKDITQDVVDTLISYGWKVTPYESLNLYFGGVQGIRFNADGSMTGGADSRRDGKALGY